MDTNISRQKRATTFRRAGWLAVAFLATLSLVGPGAAGVAAEGRAGDPAAPITIQATTVPPFADMHLGTGNAKLPPSFCKKADFGIVVDRSGSISVADAAEKNGIKGFVDAFQNAGGSGLYAGTRFSDSSATPFTSGFVAAAPFKTAVDGLSGLGWLTPTGAGITTGSGLTANDRASAPNVLLVVTDGSPNVPDGGYAYPSDPRSWLTGANAAIDAANGARAAGWVVLSIFVGAPDSELPFSDPDDQAWVDTVMDRIGGGTHTQIANFSSLASALLIASGCPTPFTDIAGTMFEKDIAWVYQEGITSGCSATLYCPLAPVTRGQMAAFLSRALNLPNTATDYFTDDNGTMFENNINRVAAAGITSGCTATTYCPNANVTRGQMAAFLARALHLPNTATDYFTDDNGSIYENNINRVAAAGITSGCTPTTYCPNLDVTRGQMAAFLHRAFGP